MFNHFEYCSITLNIHVTYRKNVVSEMQQASKIVYKLVLEADMINVSCWKLKRNTDENRAISKVIFCLITMAGMFHRFSVVNSAFDDGVFIFSCRVHSADNFNNANVVSAGVFLFKINRIFLDGLLCSLFWQPKLSIDKGLFVFFQPFFAGYLCKRMAILQK